MNTIMTMQTHSTALEQLRRRLAEARSRVYRPDEAMAGRNNPLTLPDVGGSGEGRGGSPTEISSPTTSHCAANVGKRP